MHFIDGITLATGLLGCLYGAIAGPFVTVFSILGIICAGPVLYLLYPYFFSYIPQYQNDLIIDTLKSLFNVKPPDENVNKDDISIFNKYMLYVMKSNLIQNVA